VANGQSVMCRVGPTCSTKSTTIARDLPVDVINAAPNSLHVQEMTWRISINPFSTVAVVMYAELIGAISYANGKRVSANSKTKRSQRRRSGVSIFQRKILIRNWRMH
jgi:hypothetical protein